MALLIVEQDHRFIKKITKPMMGFKAFHSAQATNKRPSDTASSHLEPMFRPLVGSGRGDEDTNRELAGRVDLQVDLDIKLTT
jgi:hypothetical protein